LPAAVIARAKEVLALLEGEGEQMAARLTADGVASLKGVPLSASRKGPRMKHAGAPTPQLGFFGEAPAAAPAPAPDPALTRLADAVGALEPDQMTPMQALTALASLKQSLRD
jgi:DNA mismatch repair protein MutS